MSRASTTATQSSSASARVSPQYESSPGSSAPALTRQSTQASQSTAAFTPSNAIDDFILFPEDSSWNPELSQADLGQFNFDINNDMDFAEFPLQNDFSFYQQPFNGGDFNVDQQIGHSFYQQQPYSQVGGQQSYTDTPLMTDSYNTPGESYDLDQYMPVSHSRPHPSGSSQNTGQLDNSQLGWSELPVSQRSGDNELLSSTSDWSVLESTLISDSPGRTDQFFTGLASIPQERVSSGRSPLSSRSSRAANANADGNVQTLASTLSSGNSRAVNATNVSSVNTGLNVQSRATISNISNRSGEPTLRYDSGSGISVDPSEILDVPLLSSRQRPSSAATVLSSLSDHCQQVSESLQTIQSSRSEYTGLGKDLQRLSSVVDVLQSRQTTVPEAVVTEARAFQSQLDALSAQIGSSVSAGTLTNPLLTTLDPDFHAEFFRQCQVEARRLVRSLCATINAVQAQNTGTHVPGNTQTLTSGRNLQLFPSPSQGVPQASLVSGAGMWTESTAMWQANNGPPANVLREDDTSEYLRSVPDANEFRLSPMSQNESGTLRLSTIRNVPVYSIMIKDARGQNERLDSQRTDGTSPQDILSVPTVVVAEDHSSILTYSGMLSQHNHLPMADRTQTSSTAQYVDSSEETVLSISPRSAILQTTTAVQESSVWSSSLLLMVVLAILGSMFLCLKVCLTTLHHAERKLTQPQVFSSLFTSPLAAFVFTQGIQTLTTMRESCNEWIGNDAFSVWKLALCAVMATQLPVPTKSNLLCGGVALFHALTSSGTKMSSEELRTSNVDIDRDDRCANAKGLLGMMMDLSPVVTV